MRRDELFKRLVAADHAAPCRLAYHSIQLSLNLTKITMAEVRTYGLGIAPWGIPFVNMCQNIITLDFT